MSGGVTLFLRIQCFHCNAMVLVPFRKMRHEDTAHDELRRHGWLFGAEALGNGEVAFDPLCPIHARETVQRMLDQGGSIDRSTLTRLQQLFPDMFRPKGV